ncbi:hypothetical protein [Priestia flexa]|uniref:Uncharacterized protein n=1 Tax=Priestia flexa TaxID=86664 RepID=A0ABU4J9A8_9BACI|nr:hypothetical protein [Priestia flexa]MDW8517593.1 hypothetical protein [Priestia flexa]SIR27720.1 hypothetical protein SAMN05880580_11620 [Priestia flexa]
MIELGRFMEMGGEKFEVFRNGEKISEVEGLPNREETTQKAYVGFYPSTDIKPGDWIRGKTSNNHFFIEDIKSHIVHGKVFQKKGYYLTEIEYKKSNEEEGKVTIIYNLNGANSRVNNNSSDHSINVIDMSPTDLFDEIRTAFKEGISDEAELRSLREIVNEMENSQNTNTFNKAYTKFITSAANHMTLISPFIPALSQMIQG